MGEKSIKDRIQNCLFALDFETQRMSSGGCEEYRKLRSLVIDLYNQNVELIKRNEELESKISRSEEEL